MVSLLHLAVAFLPIILIHAAPASLHPRSDGPQVISNCLTSGTVALTFDDGMSNHEADLMQLLNTAGAKGSFFLNGNNYACIYDHYQVVRDLFANNHTLGAHTWSHPDLVTLDDAQIHSELEKIETAFIKILGVKPLYVRPPFGSYDDRILGILAQRGYTKVFMWSDDTGDASGSTLDVQKSTMDTVTASYPSPHMVLQHSVIDSVIETTVYGLEKIKNAGYKLVTVDECLGGNAGSPYLVVGKAEEPNDSWKC